MDVREIAEAAKRCASTLATASTEQKNAALEMMASRLSERKMDIVSANEADIDEARHRVGEGAMLARLQFGQDKIESRVRSLHKIAALPDPVGKTYATDRRPNGLEVAKMRVPLGVVLMIYEARPHVTVNAGAFCLKSGNAAILKGGSEARRCNTLLGELWQESVIEAGLPKECVQVISGSHSEIDQLLQLDQYIDLVIPRGGKNLIRSVSEKSRIPVVKHFEGVCHVYIDEAANINEAIQIALDSKCLMPAVCNAMETVLIAESEKDKVPQVVDAFMKSGVTVRGCEQVQEVAPEVEPATEDDWRTEYLDMMVSIRIVKDVDEAIEHINTYGSHHTDSIVTDSESRARKFLNGVDSGVVLVNASTMYCDGESLGMGAEIGISTDKLHARGPMGLEELTSSKFVIRGQGQIMGGPYQA